MPPSPRSLADALRRRSDDEISDLLMARPDLLSPIPHSIAELAKAANSVESVSLALDRLTATDLLVLEACCALAPDHQVTVPGLCKGLSASSDPVAESVRLLHGLALLWGPDEDLRPPSAVREVMGPHPCGLDPVVRPASAVTDADQLSRFQEAATFDSAPPGTRDLLEELTWRSPLIAALEGAAPPAANWLLEQGVLRSVAETSFVLPRETSLVMRDGRLDQEPLPLAPILNGKAWPNAAVASTGAHSADLLVRTIDRVIDASALMPLRMLATGGMASRDLVAAAERLRVEPTDLALLLEVARQAGWIAESESRSLQPTRGFLDSRDLPRAERWLHLAHSWRSLAGRPWRPTDSDAASATNETPLSPELRGETIPLLKALLTDALTSAKTSLSAAELHEWLLWRSPRLPFEADLVRELLSQMERLGITGLGTMTEYGARLEDPTAAERVLALLTPLLPEESDRFVLQADLTATAPAPLTASSQRRLDLVADFESGGGATVYRFTPASLSRGLAHGETEAGLIQWLSSASESGLPKALEVLIADAARAQGQVRVTSATSVLQCAGNVADGLMADPALASLGLIRIASDVVGSHDSATEVVARLRASGYSTERTELGPQVVAPPPAKGTAAGSPMSRQNDPMVTRLARALRHAEEPPEFDARRPERPAEPANHAMTIPESLRRAISAEAAVWLDYSEADGGLHECLADPIGSDRGQVIVFDRSTGTIRTIPTARVLGVTEAHANDPSL